MARGHLFIPRSLLEHPTILSLNDLHHRIFISLLMRMCYAPCQQDDHGVIIDLEPGQYMFTLRKLASELGVDKGVLERLLIRLRDAKISRHETRHTKTILTFIYPELCELFKKQTETANETKSRQDQDKIKTEKNKVIKKEGNNIEDTNVSSCSETPSSRRSKPKADPLKFNHELSSWEGITDADHDLWKQIYPNINHGQELARAAEWARANPAKSKSKSLWRKFLNNWFTKAETDAYYRLARQGQEALYKGTPPTCHTLSDPKKSYPQQNKNYQDSNSRAYVNGQRQSEYDNL